MMERADSDPIVDAELFPVPANIGVPGLEGLAYAHLAKMYSKHAQAACEEAAPLPELPLAWGGSRKNSCRSHEAICKIPLDINRKDRRMRVFGGNHIAISPTIHLHGVVFRAVG